ncbi:MAG: cytochrome P450 [Streptosporangiales bacterium]|nr:cytochrome P450 [Streptosporangiales bacterium]
MTDHGERDAAHTPVTTEAVPLFGEDFGGDPHALYERLRREWGPVAPVLLVPGLPAWLILGYYEVVGVCRASRLFSRDTRLWADLRDGHAPPGTAVPAGLLYRPGLAFAEGDEHTRLRRCLTDALERLDPASTMRHTQEIAEELIDAFSPEGRGDLVGQYARLLPPYVLARLLGVPENGIGRFVAAVTHEEAAPHPGSPGSGDALGRELAALVQARREEPTEDLTSWLVGHPAALPDEAVTSVLHTVLRRGDGPTADLLSGALRRLVHGREPGSAEAARGLDVEDAIDEVLWTDPPVQNGAARVPTHDALLGRAEIVAGDLMLMGIAAANADPVLGRGTTGPGVSGRSGRRAHLAWGAGPYRCPAQRLARQIASVGAGVLLSRLTGLRLEVPPERLERRASPLAPGLDALPVLFEPAPANAARRAAPVVEPAFAEPDPEPEFVNPFRQSWWHHS